MRGAPILSNAMVRFDGSSSRRIHKVSIAADKDSNSVIVSGPRAEMQDVQSIIEKLDAEAVEKGRALKLIDVHGDNAEGLAALTLKVFSAQNNGRSPTNMI